MNCQLLSLHVGLCFQRADADSKADRIQLALFENALSLLWSQNELNSKNYEQTITVNIMIFLEVTFLK